MAALSETPRRQRLQSLQVNNLSPSYLHNSLSEEKVLTFVNDFRVLFHKYFRDRRPLLLTPQNECGREKMICTFIRPTSLKYDELFDLHRCSRYVAGYIQYEPLHDAFHYEQEGDDTVEKLPDRVVSPATVFEWQVGNCLEMSLALVSLLLGAGYNAYVVVGYAHKAVCLNDQTQRSWTEGLREEHNSDDDDETEPEVDPEYAVLMKPRPVLRKAGDAEPVANGENNNDDLIGAGQFPAPPLTRVAGTNSSDGITPVKPVHCWVMVLPGGCKNVKDAIFVEPSTGELISFYDADQFYIGIESLFNDRRYYINMRSETAVSMIGTDLKDIAHWECVLPTGGDVDEPEAAPGIALQSTTLTINAMRRTMADMIISSTTVDTPDATDKIGVQIPSSWVDEIILSSSKYESRFPGGLREIRYADAVVRLYADYSQPDMRVKEVVLADTLYREQKQVHVFYKHRADKLRRRSIFPPSPLSEQQQTSPSQSNRSPAFSGGAGNHAGAAGVMAPPYRLLHEWYEKGRMRETAVEGLREFIHESGASRTMKYYWRAREDGLCRRVELFYDLHSLRKVKETYKGRADNLCYRSSSFDKPRTVRETTAHSIVATAGTGIGVKEYPRLEPTRMSQKFLRKSEVPFDKDVSKMVFLRPPANSGRTGEMWVFFHYSENSIVRPYHMFAKASSNVEDYIAASSSRKPVEPPMKVVTMPGEEPPSDLALYNERKWLGGVEAVCFADVRTMFDQSMDILMKMEHDHDTVTPILSSYDTLRNRPQESETERAKKLAEVLRREESRKDYLAPYIAKLEMPIGFDGDYLKVRLTTEQAKQVRDEALLELKERLIQRGHIMQSRMDREKEDFNRRQIEYQKNCDSAAIEGSKEGEEFALYCKEATWRMKVLDERLSKHIDQASEKYAQLAQKLSEDPRLAALYSA